MAQRVNYHLEMERELARIAARGERPKLALHVCCAPCASVALERLNEAFEIVLFFYNPNIAPEAEYRRRAQELRRLASEMPLRDVRVEEGPYDAERFREMARGHERDREGGARCALCFELRLRATAEFARSIGADYFTTTLTTGRQKNEQIINELGGRIAREAGLRYLFSDFKKKNGCGRSCELSREYGLYRQDYCGCAYSRRERPEAKGETEGADA